MKTKSSVSAPKCLIQPLLESFEHNLSQAAQSKGLFQPTLGPISALGSKSALGNWTVLALIEGAELDSKIGLYFTHPRAAIFRAKTDISDLQCVHRDKITTNFFRLACSLLSCFG